VAQPASNSKRMRLIADGEAGIHAKRRNAVPFLQSRHAALLAAVDRSQGRIEFDPTGTIRPLLNGKG
jgi:hypothetical protein